MPPPPEGLQERQAKLPFLWRMAMGAWSKGWGPFSLVRYGPGLTLLRKYVGRRFGEYAWTAPAKPALAEYLCANMRHGEESWGGVAHALLLVPGAYPRSPLSERVPKLGRGGGAGSVRYVSFIYGTHDWMTYTHAEELRDRAAGEDGPVVEVCRVAGAGHNIPVRRRALSRVTRPEVSRDETIRRLLTLDLPNMAGGLSARAGRGRSREWRCGARG